MTDTAMAQTPQIENAQIENQTSNETATGVRELGVRAQQLDLRRLPHVPRAQWGKDHWSLIAYLETCAVDRGGQIQLIKLRTNVRRADRLKQEEMSVGSFGWRPSYGTQLRGFQSEEKTPELILGEHCDCACLLDFEREGLLEIEDWNELRIGQELIDLAHQLRRWKAEGGTYSTFDDPAQP